MRVVTVLVSGLVITGCGNLSHPGRDMSVPVPDFSTPLPHDMTASLDMSGPGDLAVPLPYDMAAQFQCGYEPNTFPKSRDATGFCDGTSIAGTCAQAFFAKVYACFVPAGCCGSYRGNHQEGAWASGATYSGNELGVEFPQLKMNGQFCVAGDLMGPQTFKLTTWDQSSVRFRWEDDLVTGTVICPDGSTVSVGKQGAACPALKNLLYPPEVFDYAACPEDTWYRDGGTTCCTPYEPGR